MWNGTAADLAGSVMWFSSIKEAQEWAALDGEAVVRECVFLGGRTRLAVCKDDDGMSAVYLQTDGSYRRCWLGF